MSGQDTRRTMVAGRLATCVLAIAAALLVAATATASPDSDAANGAITAAYDASGGEGGSLGPKQGDVYPVGQGFAQNYTGGKIFFTPATGAHYLRGAILEKYESLGGPADSDLGFPTIDDGPGRAPDSFNTTLSAGDNPVIFWTQATGARVVRGPINAAWDKLGGSSGALGVPADDESYSGDVVTQKFTGGELSYNTRDKTFTTVPPDLAGQLAGLALADDPISAINAARRAAGGPLAAADGPPYPIGKDGLGQDFAGGKIFYSPATGAKVVTGQVLAKYESVGGPEGDLGFPTTSEVDGGLATESRMSTFAADDKPVIFWTPDYGAVIVRGAMNAAWGRLDGAKGPLGAPMADQTESGDVVTQRFSGGEVSWNRSTGDFTTKPAILAAKLSDLQVPRQQAPERPAGPQASGSAGKKFAWSPWWLLAVVPVLLLIGLVVFATMRSRRRGRNDDRLRFDNDRLASGLHGDGSGSDVERVYSAVGPREPATPADGYPAATFGDRYASERQGAFSAPAAPSPWEPTPCGDDQAPPTSDDDEASHNDDEAPHSDDEAPHSEDEDEDPDNVDTAPTRVPTATELPVESDPPTDTELPVESDPLTDTGRHARIEMDEPEMARTAFRLPLGDSNEAPEGYPVKADTQSGRYWSPGSAGYDEVHAEIWFSSEEFAVTNGFVRGD
jgi:uncharacterized protein with LGFP repeats